MRKQSLLVSALVVSVALGNRLSARPTEASWPEFGRAVCTAPNGQTHSAITEDGAGGAIVAWQDHRNAKVNIFAEHLLPSGELDSRWPQNGQAMVADTSL